MGAQDFSVRVKAKSAAEAFKSARDAVLYEHGHGGYSGTIAEKTDTVTRAVPDGVKLDDYLSQLGASRVHQNCRGRVPAVRVGFIVNMTHEVHLRRGVLINDDPTSKAIWSGANGSIGWTTLAKSRLRPLLESSPEIHSN